MHLFYSKIVGHIWPVLFCKKNYLSIVATWNIWNSTTNLVLLYMCFFYSSFALFIICMTFAFCWHQSLGKKADVSKIMLIFLLVPCFCQAEEGTYAYAKISFNRNGEISSNFGYDCLNVCFQWLRYQFCYPLLSPLPMLDLSSMTDGLPLWH